MGQMGLSLALACLLVVRLMSPLAMAMWSPRRW